ncbi:MAG: hypothetical protein AAF214_06480 [Pseudomonadota bacterium]
MIQFLTSRSWFGWTLIALACFTLWHLRSIIRMALFGDRISRDYTDRPDLDSFDDHPPT